MHECKQSIILAGQLNAVVDGGWGVVHAGGASAAIYVNTQRERRNLILIFPFCFYISLICALACVCVCSHVCMCEGPCVEFSDACWHQIQPPTSPTPGSNNNNNGSNNNTVAAPPPLPPHPARWCLGPQPLSLCTLLTIDSRSNEGDGVLLLLEC